MEKMTLKLAALSLASWLLVPPPTRAAEEQPVSVFAERVEVSIVNVEVWVTDKEGLPVLGLGPDDFELYEDGEPVEITNFFTVAGRDSVAATFHGVPAPGEDEGATRLLGPTQAAARRPQLPPEHQLSLLVYVDHYNLRPRDRDRVIDDLTYFLEDRVALGDNVMLVSYRNRAIKVIQPFTRDRRLIAEGLKRMRQTATYRQVDDAQRFQRMRLMKEAVAEGDIPLAYDFLRSYVQMAHDDLRHSATALQTVVRSLAGLPGRRAMLYVSDGLPARPGEEMYQFLVDLAGFSQTAGYRSDGRIMDPSIEALMQDESHVLKALSREANAHQITLYTLDARGPEGESTSSAEYGGLGFGGTASGRIAMDALRTQNLQEPLLEMAEKTGGTAILNTLAFDQAFQSLAQDFESFYSLAYPTRHGGDGRYHSIEVRVRHPDLRLRHRTGFVDKPTVERVADRTLSSLLLRIEKNPLGVQVQFGDPRQEGKQEYLLPVLVRFPIGRLALVPKGELEEGQTRIFLVVQDEEGRISKLHEFPYPVSIPRDQMAVARDKETGYLASVKVRSGLLTIAVAVWDEISGIDSVVHKQVRLGSAKAVKRPAGG